MAIRVRPCGAAGEVTGSGYLVETPRARVLVDFGMFQGEGATDEKNRELGPVEPQKLDAVALTHAHLDHCGRLPLLPFRGLRARVHAAPATIDVTELILRDSASLQQQDAEREARRRGRSGDTAALPLYAGAEVDALLPLFTPLPLGERRTIAPGVEARLCEAGHILGSASVELTIEVGNARRVIVFSGDIGPRGAPLLRDPEPPPRADLVFLESTYGDRDHRSLASTVDEFKSILQRAGIAGEKVLIPAFAVGRTQQILYHVAQLRRDGEIRDFPVYLDSPMAIKATALHRRHAELLDHETTSLRRSGALARDLASLRLVESPDQSRALNSLKGPAIIIAGSGMCDGGRIMHHLKHNLPRQGVSVVLVGYMGAGTLGRRLVDGAQRVRIHGEEVDVRAKIHTLGGFSAHAGQSELADWLAPMAGKSLRVALTHGENGPRRALADVLHARYEVRAELPERGDVIALA